MGARCTWCVAAAAVMYIAAIIIERATARHNTSIRPGAAGGRCGGTWRLRPIMLRAASSGAAEACGECSP